MAQPAMTNPHARDRDEFLKALEEARRAAMADTEEPRAGRKAAASALHGSAEFRRAIDRMAGRLRSYISARLLARLYAGSASCSTPKQTASVQHPSKSEHETVVDELRLTPNLTAQDLKHIRRKFAKANHPDRVPPPRREQATRRMTIANSLIDEALRGKKTRVR